MILQGMVPFFWGPLSDSRGRRLALIGTFSAYMVANIGLGLSSSFAMLMVFRGLQAVGSAATISIGAGVIGDMCPSSERDGFMGTFGGVRMLGNPSGPSWAV
jgi:MFS family permease